MPNQPKFLRPPISIHSPEAVPFGYCHCGCGQLTSITKEASRKMGYVKGQPKRYVRGHHKKHSSALKTPAMRFWEKVATGDEDDCWPWIASVDGHNYGQFWDGEKLTRAHIFSYMVKHGAVPTGLCVCHTCDNTLCVNPKHLFIGTHKDNILDMIAKGRRHQPDVSGDKNGRYKHGKYVGKKGVKHGDTTLHLRTT